MGFQFQPKTSLSNWTFSHFPIITGVLEHCILLSAKAHILGQCFRFSSEPGLFFPGGKYLNFDKRSFVLPQELLEFEQGGGGTQAFQTIANNMPR